MKKIVLAPSELRYNDRLGKIRLVHSQLKKKSLFLRGFEDYIGTNKTIEQLQELMNIQSELEEKITTLTEEVQNEQNFNSG